MSALQSAKLWLIGLVGLGKDALHIYVGLTLYIGAVLLLRWPARDWRPWLLVAAAALAGEVWDIRDTLVAGRPVLLAHNWHDVWNTLFWPSVLLLLARLDWLRLARR